MGAGLHPTPGDWSSIKENIFALHRGDLWCSGDRVGGPDGCGVLGEGG